MSCCRFLTKSFSLWAFLVVTRCDQTSNCFDQSDEDNCKLIFMKVFSCWFLRVMMVLRKGQLQQEDCSVQLWQSEQHQHPRQHQRVHVGHRHHQDRGGGPHLYPQVQTGPRMVRQSETEQKNGIGLLPGTTTGWNISTWKRLGHRMLSPWKTSIECGFPSSSLTILRRMKPQRSTVVFFVWWFLEGCPSSIWWFIQDRKCLKIFLILHCIFQGTEDTELTLTREGDFVGSDDDNVEEINIFDGQDNRITFEQVCTTFDTPSYFHAGVYKDLQVHIPAPAVSFWHTGLFYFCLSINVNFLSFVLLFPPGKSKTLFSIHGK